MKRILEFLNVPWIVAGLLGVTVLGVLALSYSQGVKLRHQVATVSQDRDAMGRWSDVTCALTGQVYRAPGMKRKEWGVACQAEIQKLADFRKQTLESSNSAMAEHFETQLKKATADLTAARKANEQSAQALKRMEAANAAIKDDRVDGDWFGALNELGGLRAPSH